jgi:hypothetical protein
MGDISVDMLQNCLVNQDGRYLGRKKEKGYVFPQMFTRISMSQIFKIHMQKQTSTPECLVNYVW